MRWSTWTKGWSKISLVRSFPAGLDGNRPETYLSSCTTTNPPPFSPPSSSPVPFSSFSLRLPLKLILPILLPFLSRFFSFSSLSFSFFSSLPPPPRLSKLLEFFLLIEGKLRLNMLCFFGFGTVSVDMIGVALVFVDVRYRPSGSVRDRLLDIELK
jgi:hypothetical protein